ncbi:MAG: hypothetical protein SGARI_005582 [Bacillariaceae sp.]
MAALLLVVPVRTGTLKCPCGAVEFDLHVPPSSYALVEQTNAICHCNDCVGFCYTLPNRSKVMTSNNGTFMINFYKSDVKLTKGRDAIQGVRLYKQSPMLRTYCGKCGTPLGADVTVAPICLLNEALIKYSVEFLPALVLGFKQALPGTKPYARTVVVKQQNFGPIFMCKTILRLLLGLLFGKGRGGFLENSYEQGFPVGLVTLKIDRWLNR